MQQSTSSTTNSTPQCAQNSSSRRVRTKTQLERKRECDRNNHKLMRQGHKSRLDLLESEVRRLGNDLSKIINSRQSSEDGQVVQGIEDRDRKTRFLDACQNSTCQYPDPNYLPNGTINNPSPPLSSPDNHNSSSYSCKSAGVTRPAVRSGRPGGKEQVIGKDEHQSGLSFASFSQTASFSQHPTDAQHALYVAKSRNPNTTPSIPLAKSPLDPCTIDSADLSDSQDNINDASEHSLSPSSVDGCMCPLAHDFDNPCFEFTVSTLLSLSHTALLTSVTSLQPLPRSPSSRNYLLIDSNDNLVIKILSHALCDLSFIKLADMCAAYFIMYRLLRVCPIAPISFTSSLSRDNELNI